jgi:exodeoxyribonuclease VII large subunit
MPTPLIELPVLSVSALTQSIKLLLEGQFRFVCVQGEVSNCKLQTSGHLYFSLKDAGAQISAVMFKGDVTVLSRIPQDGDQVIIKGSLNVYPPNGKYQIVVRNLELAGLGALLLKQEQLKAKLKLRGYFSQEHKKSLPRFPKTIGVVTSPTGAVIQDILHILTRRFSGFHLILNPVKVQGEGAAAEIAAAIQFFNQHKLVDVLIVGRGGGSIEDLMAFNEEIVAEAIYKSTIPIISAVGHETDHCIADYVADARAPTPSAAAEMVIAEKALQLKMLSDCRRTLQHTLVQLIRHLRQSLLGVIKHPFFLSPYGLLGHQIQRLDELRIHCDRRIREMLRIQHLKLSGMQKQINSLSPSNKIIHFREKFFYLQKSLDQSILKKREKDKNYLDQILLLLRALDPKNLLTKGYSIVFSEKDNSIINSVHSLNEGDSVKLLFADGKAYSTINEIEFK